MSRVGLVGYGRIGARVAAHLGPAAPVVAILARSPRPAPRGATVTDSPDAFLAERPDIVLEAASGAALREHGPAILRAGIDLVPLSLCALLDARVEEALREAIRQPGAGRLLLAPGALGGLDGLAAAREAGLDRAVYRTVKPVSVWRRTAAAGLVDLDAIRGETTILRGSVRELAAAFPDNLNVAVGAALAGLGPDRTELELAADPDLAVTIHELEFWGRPGHVRLRLVGTDPDPLADCGDYTAFSVLGILRTRSAAVTLWETT